MFLHVSVRPHGRGWYPSMPCRSPDPHPRGELEGSGQPTPMGVGLQHLGGLQAHTLADLQVYTWGVSLGPHLGGCWSPGPHPGGDVSQHALRQTPSLPADGYCRGGTHPTGMHSCLGKWFCNNTYQYLTDTDHQRKIFSLF